MILSVLLLAAAAGAQNTGSLWSSYVRESNASRTRFLDGARKSYGDFLRQAWKEAPVHPPVRDPFGGKDDAVIPPREDRKDGRGGNSSGRDGLYRFSYFGMRPGVRYDHGSDFVLAGVGENEVADAWERLAATDAFAHLLDDCRGLRDGMSLCDWAYVQLLDSLAASVYPDRLNERQVFFGCLLNSSGFLMRMGRSGERLACCVGVSETIYRQSYYDFDGVMYYSMRPESAGAMCFSELGNPRARAVSLYPDRAPAISGGGVVSRHIRSHGVETDFVIDRNLLAFYDAYPHVSWTIKASAPVSPAMSDVIYPLLREKIAGKSEYEALAFLQLFVGNVMEYEDDATYWSREKWNFPEESMYYDRGDCDDHAILFCRLVRDLLGLDTVILHMTVSGDSHLAAAVKMNMPFTGETLMYEGERYIICEPTSSYSRPGDKVWKSLRVERAERVR